MTIHKATMDDLPEIMRIIDAAKKFFRENGIDQWQRGTPNESTILNDIKNGESYVVKDNGKICATAMISLRGEPTYVKIDGSWLYGGEYGVIHRVAVCPERKKSGLGSLLIEKAREITAAASFLSLRADTHEMNAPMRGMLEKNGFYYCGTITLSDGAPRRAYEIYPLEKKS